MKLCSWNINGLKAFTKKIPTNNGVINYLNTFDVVCLQETRCHIDDFNQNNYSATFSLFPHFSLNFNSMKGKAGYSGVAIFSKQQFIQISLGYPSGRYQKTSDKLMIMECRVIAVEFEKINLLTNYTPNSGQQLQRLNYRVDEWDRHYQAYVNELKSKKPTLLAGDFNVVHQEIDVYGLISEKTRNAGVTLEERESFAKFLQSGWNDTYRLLNPDETKYSWFAYNLDYWRLKKGWRVDYFLACDQLKKFVTQADINYDFRMSDHQPIEVEIVI